MTGAQGLPPRLAHETLVSSRRARKKPAVAEIVVVPVDFSESSENAIHCAPGIAKANGARLQLVTVLGHRRGVAIARVPEMADELLKQVEEHHEGWLDVLLRAVGAVGVWVTTDMLARNLADEILRTLDRCGGGVLAKGTYDRSGLSHWRHDRIASSLVQEAPAQRALSQSRESMRKEASDDW